MSESHEFTLLADRVLLRDLRDSLRVVFEGWQIDETAAMRVLLVVDEIVGNAIDHGGDYRCDEHILTLRVELRDGDVRVEFIDPDTPQPVVNELVERIAAATEPPALDAERGRGMFLIGNTFQGVDIAWDSATGMRVRGIVRDVMP